MDSRYSRYIGGLFYLLAAAVPLGACKEPSSPDPGQSLTFHQKFVRQMEQRRWQQHCCRRGSRNNKH